MRNVADLVMVAGNILVIPDDGGGADTLAGIVVQREHNDQAIGKVVVSSIADFIPGQLLVYKRVIAQDIRLLDDDGRENLYKIIHVDDVTAIFNDGTTGRA